MGAHADSFLAWFYDREKDATSPDELVYQWSEYTGLMEPKLVSREVGDQGRWYQAREEVWEFVDGSLLRSSYQEGLTENQEDWFEDQDWDKVEEYTELVKRYRSIP